MRDTEAIMESFESALRTLTRTVCSQFEGVEIPTRPVWTVVRPPEGTPHLAMDPSRLALSDVSSTSQCGFSACPSTVRLRTLLSAILNSCKV
jgi:hypothetical protein